MYPTAVVYLPYLYDNIHIESIRKMNSDDEEYDEEKFQCAHIITVIFL